MYKSTRRWSKYWKTRVIDWKKDYLDNWNHPHRFLLLDVLSKGRPFNSLCEIGCASGPNLALIQKAWPGLQLGGVDVVPEAIECAQKYVRGQFDCRSGEKLFFGKGAVDVVLTDMALIYMDPFKIMDCLKEMKRITRKRIVLCEFYHPSWILRQMLRLGSGYHAYDYPKLLKKAGFYDIVVRKIPLEAWPGGEPQKTFGFIITASAV